MTERAAIIGLDGLTTTDTTQYAPHIDTHEYAVTTVAHTCPSWNTILSGHHDPRVVDFFQIPYEYEPGESVASQSDTQWRLRDLEYEYVWERIPGVEVASAPIILPAYSTVFSGGRAPMEYAWPTTPNEIEEGMDALYEATTRFDRVVTVFPVPDKLNHLRDNAEKDYSARDRDAHMKRVFRYVDALTDEFDRWVVVSDHGEPSVREWVREELWVASHDPVGVLASNCVDVSGVEGSGGVCGVLGAVLEGGGA